MAKACPQPNPDGQAGGGFVHVKDSRIWAEISYLDSATNYREYLPLSRVPSRDVQDSILTMLDSNNHSLKDNLTRQLLLVLATVSLLISSGYLLYRLADLL